MNEDTIKQYRQARDVALREAYEAGYIDCEDAGTVGRRIMTANALNEKLLMAEGECQIKATGEVC